MDEARRIENYLQRHKIGALFEDLMAKVVADMPEEPVPYIIRQLSRKTDKMSLRKTTESGKVRSPSPDALRRSMPAWAASNTELGVAKDHTYEKPWQTNSRRLKPKHTAETRKSMSAKPDWDSTNKMTAPNFDELWDAGQGLKSSMKGQRSQSPKRATIKSVWAENEDEELLYRSYGYRGPRSQRSDADPLAGEFSVGKPSKSTQSEYHADQPGKKLAKAKYATQNHKRDLERMILQDQERRDSGFEEEVASKDDDAVELMENADDLRSEGVMKIKGSGGVKMSKSLRQSANKPAQVRVSICARCARVMGGEPSEPAPGRASYGQLDDNEVDTGRGYESRPQSGLRFSPGIASDEDDEEFESVSQVTGPRRPVWQNEDSDAEGVTPRKGQHMFKSSGVPSKGRPMYSPDIPDSPISHRPPKLQQHRSHDMRQSAETSRTDKTHTLQGRTWSPGMHRAAAGFDSSEEDEELSASMPAGMGEGQGWQVPDYESDSSVAWAQYTKSAKAGRKPHGSRYN